MARYLGDTFILTGLVYDANGQLADATAVTITIRQPDASNAVTGAATTHAGTGTYTYSFAPVQAGMHSAEFVGTGLNGSVAPVDFYVYPAVSPGIVTLAETKKELRIASTVTQYDDQLRGWIQSSRALIEQRTGPLVPRTVVDVFDGGKASVILTLPPVISITSITEGTYTLQAGDFKTSNPSGTVTRMFGAFPYRFLDGRQNITVTYQAGVAGVWPENIRLANLELLRTWWVASQAMSRPEATGSGSYAPDENVGMPAGMYMPQRVERMLGTSDLPPGIA